MDLKKLGPEFIKKSHQKAIYTSRPLSSLTSECLSISSSSIILAFDDKQGPLNVLPTSLKKRNIEESNIETY
ncbi:hypothetical protein C1645_834259 [Glomus cerebriforme]|uniref:Uncharacterized protein n=1 Tax=Glomus cerebriforme TaxID=658196 RepID=A0A397S9V5_9GLOM|nr:hypothetical protein C1645_834259 [Glomus cerebriforme]